MTESHEKQKHVIEQPEVSFRTFDLKFLSDSPEGFNVSTRHSLRRHEPNAPMPQAKRIAVARAREPIDLRIGEHFAPKVGIRDIVQEGNNLIFDVIPVTFPTYVTIRKPEETPDALLVSNPAATSMVLLTTEQDGSHKMVFQHRSEKNRLYGDIPGSSVAGYLDGTLDRTREGRGKLLPMTTDSIKERIITEAGEEIGVQPDEISDLRITGIASDKVAIHDEFLLLGTTKLSSQELVKRTGLGDYFRFSEKFFVVDATPENVETLLTQVRCPLPPTHTATFLAAGYYLILERDGISVAEEWKKRIGKGINKNYQEIDALVKKFYENNPEALSDKSKGIRNPNGYDPAYRPIEQGLPNAIEEFERTGLIIKEVEKTVDEAFIFDVDGPVSDPGEKHPTIDGVLDAISEKLAKNEPVAFNTGRSLSWMLERVIAPLILKVKEKSNLQNFFAVGEKGGTWLTFDDQGRMTEHKDESISVPQELTDKVRRLVETEFSDTTFFDESKLTMVSTEMLDSIKDEREKLYVAAQHQIVSRMRELLIEMGIEKEFKIDPTTIATDIENDHVGKHFAVRRIIKWLAERNIKPEVFITFGDSHSDIPMAEELYSQGLPVEFVYVGQKPIDPSQFPFNVTITDAHFEKGTLEFLNSR